MLECRYGPDETMERLVAAIAARGMSVFLRLDHAAAAHAAGLPLRPTALVVFGNARAGTPLMQAAQTIGLDLPLRALVWQDEAGRTWLTYADPHALAQRHAIGTPAAAAVTTMVKTLATIAREATDGVAP
jgi:uncharacterized protein (DUF302 family)